MFFIVYRGRGLKITSKYVKTSLAESTDTFMLPNPVYNFLIESYIPYSLYSDENLISLAHVTHFFVIFFPSPCPLFIILQLSNLLCHLYLLVLPVSCSMQTPVVTYVTVTAKSGSLPYTLLLTQNLWMVHWQFDVADPLLNSSSPSTPDISPVFSVGKWVAPPSLQVPKV